MVGLVAYLLVAGDAVVPIPRERSAVAFDKPLFRGCFGPVAYPSTGRLSQRKTYFIKDAEVADSDVAQIKQQLGRNRVEAVFRSHPNKDLWVAWTPDGIKTDAKKYAIPTELTRKVEDGKTYVLVIGPTSDEEREEADRCDLRVGFGGASHSENRGKELWRWIEVDPQGMTHQDLVFNTSYIKSYPRLLQPKIGERFTDGAYSVSVDHLWHVGHTPGWIQDEAFLAENTSDRIQSSYNFSVLLKDGVKPDCVPFQKTYVLPNDDRSFDVHAYSKVFSEYAFSQWKGIQISKYVNINGYFGDVAMRPLNP